MMRRNMWTRFRHREMSLQGNVAVFALNLKNAVGIKLPPRRRKDAKEKQEFEQNAYDLCLHQTGESWLCCKSFALLASLREKLSLLRFLG